MARNIDTIGGLAQAALGPAGTPIDRGTARFTSGNIVWTLTDDLPNNEVQVTATVAQGPPGPGGGPGPAGGPGPSGSPGPAGGPGPPGVSFVGSSLFFKFGNIGSAPARSSSASINVGGGTWRMFMWVQSKIQAGNLGGQSNDWVNITGATWSSGISGTFTLNYQTQDPGGVSDVIINPAFQAFGS